MPYIKNDDIRGYYIGEQIVCCECLADDDGTEPKEPEYTSNDLITTDDIEKADGEYFCDICNKPLV